MQTIHDSQEAIISGELFVVIVVKVWLFVPRGSERETIPRVVCHGHENAL